MRLSAVRDIRDACFECDAQVRCYRAANGRRANVGYGTFIVLHSGFFFEGQVWMRMYYIVMGLGWLFPALKVGLSNCKQLFLE